MSAPYGEWGFKGDDSQTTTSNSEVPPLRGSRTHVLAQATAKTDVRQLCHVPTTARQHDSTTARQHDSTKSRKVSAQLLTVVDTIV